MKLTFGKINKKMPCVIDDSYLLGRMVTRAGKGIRVWKFEYNNFIYKYEYSICSSHRYGLTLKRDFIYEKH